MAQVQVVVEEFLLTVIWKLQRPILKRNCNFDVNKNFCMTTWTALYRSRLPVAFYHSECVRNKDRKARPVIRSIHLCSLSHRHGDTDMSCLQYAI